MANPMISDQWPRFVLPIIRKEWDQKMNAVASPLMSLLGVGSSTSSVEYSQGVGYFGLIPEYNSATAEGAPAAIQYDSFSPLYEATFTHKEYAKGVSIERKLVDDNRTGQIIRKAQSLGHAFGTTRAYHASSILNNAFATVTGYDSVYLCSASHPTNENDSTAISNLGTTALSYAAVVAVLIAGNDFDDDRGYPMPSVFDVLYVPTALQAKAYEIVNAIGKPGSADNDANFLASRGLRVVVDPYLTDANNWFMIDSAQASMHALWFNRVNPELTMDPASDYNLVAKYRGYMRYSFGWDDFRWVYGQSVT
jgi:phage major head subunit gpT-like protein